MASNRNPNRAPNARDAPPNPTPPRRDAVVYVLPAEGGPAYSLNLSLVGRNITGGNRGNRNETGDPSFDDIERIDTEFNIAGVNRTNPNHYPVFNVVEYKVERKIIACKCKNPACALIPMLCVRCLDKPATRDEMCLDCYEEMHTPTTTSS